MNAPNNKLSPFFEKFLKEGKVKFPRRGIIVIEDKLENLLLLIEALEEEGIPVRDNLGTYYLKKGSILSKPVKLYILDRKIAHVFPGESF